MTDTALGTTMTIRSVTGDALAKINLTLDVLGRRDDGFHELRSLAVGVDFGDRLTCQLASDQGLALSCSVPALEKEDNLVILSAGKLARHLSLKPSCRIDLDKTLPVGGGLGGGSSNAATTLRLCNKLWGGGLSDAELAAVGADLGSDIPLFFSLPAAVMTGRGERVEAVSMRWTGWVLLVSVDVLVSTVEVYREWRPSDSAGRPSGKDEEVILASSANEMSPLLSNHLEPAVFRVAPQVGKVWDHLNRAAVGPFRVSGAGSTLYRLFDDKGAALEAAHRIEGLGLGLTTVVASAPVAPSPIVTEES